MGKKRNVTIDVFRLIASILIIFIHTSMIKINGYIKFNPNLYIIASTISRYCVPIFMMITGYFYYLKPSKLKRNKILKKLFSLWIIWMFIYLPMGLMSIKEFSVAYLSKFLIKQIFFSSNFFWGSWYLTATMFGIIFVDYCIKKKSVYISAILAVLLSIIDSITSYYYFSFKPYSLFLGMPGNFSMSIFTGIIWITLSYYIVKYQKKLSYFGKLPFVFLAIIITFTEFYLMTLIEPYPDYRYPGAMQSPLFLPISVFLTFMFIITHKYYLKRSTVIWMRDLSTLIFFVQFGVIDLINVLVKNNILYINVNVYTWVVVSMTIFISYLLYLISLHTKFKLIQYLY